MKRDKQSVAPASNPCPHPFDKNCFCHDCNKVRKEYAKDIEGIVSVPCNATQPDK
jgi:hypothetical protein